MAIGRFTIRKAVISGAPIPVNDVLVGVAKDAPKPKSAPDTEQTSISQRLLDAKLRIHRRLIDEINLSAVDKLSEKEMFFLV